VRRSRTREHWQDDRRLKGKSWPVLRAKAERLLFPRLAVQTSALGKWKRAGIGQYRSLDRWLSAEDRSENREHTEQTQTYQDWPTTTHNFLCERHASTQHKDRDNKNKDQYCRND
ncbi:MAG: hypothetical protein WBM57_05910, partial [Woeseiaceae bacterium]